MLSCITNQHYYNLAVVSVYIYNVILHYKWYKRRYTASLILLCQVYCQSHLTLPGILLVSSYSARYTASLILLCH